MRLAAAALLLAPSIATANPITFGVTAGLHHDQVAEDGQSNDTLGLFGRLGFSKRVSGQLEVQKIENDYDAYYETITLRTVTALLVVDLVDHGRLVPVLLVGAGLDRADTQYDSMSGHHYEGGLGLEYRAEGGVTIGADFRMGGRSVDNDQYETQPVLDEGVPTAWYLPTDSMPEGEYRSVRLNVGVRF